MDSIALILTPIIEAMRLLLRAGYAVTRDHGVSIILLSIVVRVVTVPIARLATKSEEKSRATRAAMQPELDTIRATSKGRERFERTDEVYQRHKYHPIQATISILPLFLQIPFLLSALFLLSDYQPLAGQAFLLIADLLRPDALLSAGGVTINALPLLITGVAVIESAITPTDDRSAKLRFLIIAVVIAVLIYASPAGVCLYWLTSNVVSLLRASIRKIKARPIEHA